jgi:hypothetical protein
MKVHNHPKDMKDSNRVKMIAHGDTFGEDIIIEVQHVRVFSSLLNTLLGEIDIERAVHG